MPQYRGLPETLQVEMPSVIDKTEPIGAKLARLLLEAALWASLIMFVAVTVLVPTELGKNSLSKWLLATYRSYYGFAVSAPSFLVGLVGAFGFLLSAAHVHGSLTLLWGGPILLLVFLGAVHIYIFPRSLRRSIRKKSAKPSLATNPVIVSGPFGVVSAAELLCILAFIMIMAWMLVLSIRAGLESAAEKHKTSSSDLWQLQLKAVARRLGFVGQVCLGLLFLPVGRGSVLLRLVDIPFEHAVKYHIWLGHFTMSIFSLHGLFYIVAWTWERHLVEKVLSWKLFGVANLAGFIALVAGLLMWVTSFQITRIHAFELFFCTHQLYIIFIIFMALHVGDFLFGIAFAGIFLFTFDRFLRFCQSRKEVGVVSAKLLPCGTFQLMLAKPPNVQYSALSFIFLNLPQLGRLQWHPFSVASSPKDGKDHMKFLIKPLGTWTQQLNEAISKAAAAKCPLGLKAAVEGPYGHETSYFLDYEALVLVAGGIGVAPFVAIIRDLLHRYQANEAPLPRDVTLVWAVKRHEELAILDSLSPVSIFPDYASQLNLTVKAYVTREEEEEENVEEAKEELPLFRDDAIDSLRSTKYDLAAVQKPLCHLAGSGNILCVGVAIAASLVGYLVIIGLIGKFYLLPIDHNSYRIVPWWVRGAIVCLSIIFGIGLFGGSAIFVWSLFGSVISKKLIAATEPLSGSFEEYAAASDTHGDKLVQRSNTIYGSRPDLQEIFEGCAKRLFGSNVGVLVCGPEGLQTSVATQCRAFNTIHYKHHHVGFSYHSVSFDL